MKSEKRRGTPKAYIEFTHGSYEYVLPEDEYRTKVYNLLLAAKRNLTKLQRQIEYARENWNEIFPIEEHPKWCKVLETLRYYEERKRVLEVEYEAIC